MHWENAEARPLPVAELGECYRRYRLADPAAEEAMARSLHQYGQLSPLTTWPATHGVLPIRWTICGC